jgi:hypothetical protein
MAVTACSLLMSGPSGQLTIGGQGLQLAAGERAQERCPGDPAGISSPAPGTRTRLIPAARPDRRRPAARLPCARLDGAS